MDHLPAQACSAIPTASAWPLHCHSHDPGTPDLLVASAADIAGQQSRRNFSRRRHASWNTILLRSDPDPQNASSGNERKPAESKLSGTGDFAFRRRNSRASRSRLRCARHRSPRRPPRCAASDSSGRSRSPVTSFGGSAHWRSWSSGRSRTASRSGLIEDRAMTPEKTLRRRSQWSISPGGWW